MAVQLAVVISIDGLFGVLEGAVDDLGYSWADEPRFKQISDVFEQFLEKDAEIGLVSKTKFRPIKAD